MGCLPAIVRSIRMSNYFISKDAAGSDLLAAAAYIAERMPESDERGEAVSAVVSQYLSRGEVDVAAGLADTVEDPFVRDRLLIAVAAKCADIDDDDYAIQLSEAIEEQNLAAQAIENIGRIKAGKGEFEKASEMAAKLAHPDEVFAAIAVKRATNGEESEAAEALAAIEHPATMVAALMTIAAEMIGREAEASAAEYLGQAASAAVEIDLEEEKIRALADIGSALVDAKRNDKAIEGLDKARGHAEALDNVHRDDLLALIAAGFMRAGSVDLADRTLDMVGDKTQISAALLGFARELWRRGEHEDALEALDESYEVLRSQRDSETRDSRAKYTLFASIAAQYAGFERGERAIELAEAIEAKDASVAALSQTAQVLALRGFDELAVQALNAISEPLDRTQALIGMSDAKATAGDRNAAIELLSEAAELAGEVPQLTARTNVIIEIADRSFGHDEPDQAARLATRALETISLIRGEGSRATALAKLSGFYEKADIKLNPEEKELLGQMLLRSAV